MLFGLSLFVPSTGQKNAKSREPQSSALSTVVSVGARVAPQRCSILRTHRLILHGLATLKHCQRRPEYFFNLDQGTFSNPDSRTFHLLVDMILILTSCVPSQSLIQAPTPAPSFTPARLIAPNPTLPANPDAPATQRALENVRATHAAQATVTALTAQTAATQEAENSQATRAAAEATQAARAAQKAKEALNAQATTYALETAQAVQYIDLNVDSSAKNFIERSFSSHKVQVYHPTGKGNPPLEFADLGFVADASGEYKYLLYERVTNEKIGYINTKGEWFAVSYESNSGLMPLIFKTYLGKDRLVESEYGGSNQIFGQSTNSDYVDPNQNAPDSDTFLDIPFNWDNYLPEMLTSQFGEEDTIYTIIQFASESNCGPNATVDQVKAEAGRLLDLLKKKNYSSNKADYQIRVYNPQIQTFQMWDIRNGISFQASYIKSQKNTGFYIDDKGVLIIPVNGQYFNLDKHKISIKEWYKWYNSPSDQTKKIMDFITVLFGRSLRVKESYGNYPASYNRIIAFWYKNHRNRTWPVKFTIPQVIVDQYYPRP
jgi:hypothetical protein